MHDAASHALPISLQAKLKSLRSPRANTSEPLRQGTTDICKTCRFISIRSRPRHSRGRQSNNAVAIPLLPIQPRRSGSHLAGHFRMDSPLAAQQFRIYAKNRGLGTNVIRHRGTEKNLRRSRHAHESVGQQASRQRFGGCDLEMVGFAICKNGRSQFIALLLVGGSRLVHRFSHECLTWFLFRTCPRTSYGRRTY